MAKLVALRMDGPRFVEELEKVWYDEDTAMPLDTRLSDAAQMQLIKEMGAGIVVDVDGTRHHMESGWPTHRGDALVVPTSGTTGQPKGVVLTYDAVLASARLTNSALAVNIDDHWLACLPVAHIGGLSVITRSLLSGTKLTALPRFSAPEVEDAARNGATLVSLVRRAMNQVDTTLFRKILVGGGPAPENPPENCVVTYGMTETGSGIVYDHYPLPTVKVRVEPDGQLAVRSPTLLRRYRDGSNPLTPDGWFLTGDAGSVAEDGRVEVYGRIDDLINTGGEKVWPAEVENVIREHDSVREVLVRGEPDDEWGQRVVAILEIPPGRKIPSLAELRDHVKAKLPAYAAPKEIRTVDHLPRTTSGKVRRRADAGLPA